MKRLLLPIFCCLALAGFFVFQSEDSISTLDPVSDPAIEDHQDRGETLRADARDPDGARTRDAAGGVGESRTEVGGELGAEVREQVLLVRAAGTKSPAPGAEVFVLAMDGRERGPRRPRWNDQHWSERALEEGVRLVADAQGQVRAPVGRRGALVAARRPGEYGATYLRRRRDQPQELQLTEDETLVVEVVDADGVGVNAAPVALQQLVPTRPRKEDYKNRIEALIKAGQRRGGALDVSRIRMLQEMEKNLLSRASRGARRRGRGRAAEAAAAAGAAAPTTRLDQRMRRVANRQGRAVFRHLQLFRRKPEKWWKAGQQDRWQVALLVPAAVPVTEGFPGQGLPSEPVRLQMPEHGQVRVRVVDHLGKVFANAGRISLRVEGVELPKWLQLSGRKERQEPGTVFPFVGVGLQVRPLVALDDRDFSWDGPLVSGPQRQGEERVVDVAFPSSIGLLRGTVRAAENAALKAGTRLTFLVTGANGRVEGEDLTLDPDGAFQLPFKMRKGTLPPYHLEIRDRRSDPPRAVRVAVPNLALGKTTDTGTLELEALPVFASGVVVNDLGEPVRRATIQLQRERPTGGGKRGWRDESYLKTRTADQGTFALHAAPPTGRYRLMVGARGHFAVPAMVNPGDEVRLVLERESDLIGRVMMPSWLPDRGVQWELRSASGATGKLPRGRLRSRGGEKHIEFRDLRAGVYDLVVRVAGFREPAMLLRGLVVAAGQNGVHPQLNRIDLTGLYRYQIRAVDTAGAAIARLSSPLLVRLGGAAGSPQFTGFPWNKGQVEFFSREPQVEVVQLNAGYAVTRATVQPGEQVLQFQTLPPVELVIPGLRAAVGPEMRVRISTVLVGDSGLPTSLTVQDARSGAGRSYSRAQLGKSSGGWLRETDTVSVSLMRPGRYQVVARLRGQGVASVPVPLATVVLNPAPGSTQRVSVPMNLQKMQTGLAKVQALLQAKAQQPAKKKR